MTVKSLSPAPTLVLRARPPAQPVAIIDEIRKTARGALILKDWLGAGGRPVPHDLALNRARTCIACPQNQPAKWWEGAKDAIANAIKEHLSVKRALHLDSPLDNHLGTCKVCGCNLPLAIWVPLEYIKAKTPPAELEKFEPFCWKKKEHDP